MTQIQMWMHALEWLNDQCDATKNTDPEAYSHYVFVRDELFENNIKNFKRSNG